MLEDVYKDKTVLVTGHTGFKGAWLRVWLGMLEANVVGYSLDPPGEPNMFEAVGLEDQLVHIHGEIRDPGHLQAVFEEHRPDIVFHLAAQTLVRRSYREPRLTYETNVMGTVNVLETVRRCESVKAVVSVTSDKCYENREWLWGYREDDSMGGRDPYSSSKGCAELVGSAYLRSFFDPQDYGRTHNVALATARAGNVIGGGDWGDERLIPDSVRALSKGETIALRSPDAIRPWQHVLEPVSAYLLLGAKLWEEGPRFSGGWNVGPMDAEVWSVEDVVLEVCRLWGQGDYTLDSRPHPPEAHWLKLDCSKARIRLGWLPKYCVREALEKTVDWYKAYYSGLDVAELRRFTVRQIQDYAARAPVNAT